MVRLGKVEEKSLLPRRLLHYFYFQPPNGRFFHSLKLKRGFIVGYLLVSNAVDICRHG